MSARRALGRRGLSMVEVMIAISVLAFVLLAFLSVMQSSAALSASSRETSIAAFQLQAALESTFALAYEDFLEVYDPAAFPDGADPDHAAGGSWQGHLGSHPNGTNPSRVPDFCQANGSSGQNHSWTPGSGWAPGDLLPLLNQHMKITWLNQDAATPPTWVEYRLTLTWTNYKGKTQTDSITTRRSR